MRSVIYVLALCLVVAFAFGSYWIKYDTQERLAKIKSLREQITHEHERIAILEAEWAWLNNPDRLARLAAQHGADLGLQPIDGAQFGAVGEIAPPPQLEEHEREVIEQLLAAVLSGAEGAAPPAAPAPRPRPAVARLAALP
jgi:hypothetical protein